MCVLIGYTAKQPMPRPERFQLETVREIASVSECIAHRPEGWIDEWQHNDWFVYDTPELARQIAVKLGAGAWPIDAYRVLPTQFEENGEVPLAIQTEAVPIPPSFERLGWDVASRGYTLMFECSPLSCNRMAAEIPVNDMCLLRSLDEAIAIARRFAREQPEPGNYFVVEVWREVNR
jgi:hypothetical protein